MIDLEKLDDFVLDLIAPFSIHRKKYARPHGTVARREFANRANKRLNQLLLEARIDEVQRSPYYSEDATHGYLHDRLAELNKQLGGK